MEIKLRVYSVRKQRMFYPGEFRVKFNRDGAKHILLCDPTEPNSHYEKKNTYVLMLWTGLKDRFDKDIYDGDLVKYFGKWDKDRNVLPPDFELHQIEWCMGGFHAIPAKFMHISNPEGWKGVGHTSCEIVGNIYENLELLNV